MYLIGKLRIKGNVFVLSCYVGRKLSKTWIVENNFDINQYQCKYLYLSVYIYKTLIYMHMCKSVNLVQW